MYKLRSLYNQDRRFEAAYTDIKKIYQYVSIVQYYKKYNVHKTQTTH